MISWVWQYMIQDNDYDICKVLVINMQNKESCCGQQFLHDGSTGNIANHLRRKHSIYEGINKQPDKSIQLTVSQVMEKVKNRLLKLLKAIEWLDATLPLSDNYNDCADGRRLKKWLLLPHEWNLLKQIVDLLEPFEDATTYFSGTSYATLSIIYPLIQVFKFKYAENDEVNNDDLELEQDAPNFQHEESDEESDLSDSDEEDNPELDTPEQSTTHHH
ncbi:hypothetical protein C1646_787566 [Rhizophagus diaphanus]|nr:hypothetical protein C1646_787566 [Rhizophagus diaphanus] [Rhizophagus sp. MUCL 43196]